MKEITPVAVAAFCLVLAAASPSSGQDDETRRATGLPILVGENLRAGNRMNVSGRILLEGARNLKRPPKINVIVSYAGSTADSAFTNDQGYFLVRNVPRNNVSLVVEVDGQEVLRQPVIAPPMGDPRFDFTIPWPTPTGEAKPAAVTVEQLYKRSDKNEELFGKAVAAAKAGDARTAAGLYDQILAADSKDYAAWAELGTLYFKAGQHDNAEACYFKAIELRKDYFVALLNLGKLYVAKKQFDSAIVALSNAVKVNSSSPDAHHFLGEAYLQSKKGSSAIYHLTEAIRLAPAEKSELHLRIAALYDAGNMKDKAAEQYRLFLEKNPSYHDKATLERYIKENSAK